MYLTQLRYFQTIASCGSMTAAAKMLRVSQPTLTVAIRHLEERLGTTLLFRERLGVRLTTTGEVLLRHASEVFAELDRAEQEIRGLEAGDIGAFVIGCHESLGAYFLPDFMATFLREAPRIQLSLWNASSAEVQRAVTERHVHFGLVVNPSPDPDLVLVELFHDAVELFLAVDAEISPTSQRIRRAPDPLPEAAAGPLSPEYAHSLLRAGPLLFAGRVHQCQSIIEQLASLALLPSSMISCGDFELVKSLTLGGVGVGLMPRRIAQYGHHRRLRRLHPALPSFSDTITLIYRADMHRTAAAMRLKDALTHYGRRLDDAEGLLSAHEPGPIGAPLESSAFIASWRRI